MAKLSMKLKQSRPAKFSTRAYTRCRICGRPHSVLRKYGVFLPNEETAYLALHVARLTSGK